MGQSQPGKSRKALFMDLSWVWRLDKILTDIPHEKMWKWNFKQGEIYKEWSYRRSVKLKQRFIYVGNKGTSWRGWQTWYYGSLEMSEKGIVYTLSNGKHYSINR